MSAPSSQIIRLRYFGCPRMDDTASTFCRWAALLLIAILAPAAALAQNQTGDFDKANQEYAQGKFAAAAETWQRLLTNGHASTAIYFNLGNAWFKGGKLGKAIVAYRRAESITPRDPDVQANLKFARNRVQGLSLARPSWTRAFGKLSLNEWTLAAAGVIWAWLLLLGAIQWQPAWRLPLRNYVYAGAALSVILCGLLGFVFYQSRLPLAVVAVPQAMVRQAPVTESESVFTLNDGAELRVLDRKNQWLQITPNGTRTGWIREDQVLLTHGV